MSGMYAVNAKAMPVLAVPFDGEAPEVEALLRLERAGLKVEELPVSMRERRPASRSSAARRRWRWWSGVGATLWMGRRLLFRKR